MTSSVVPSTTGRPRRQHKTTMTPARQLSRSWRREAAHGEGGGPVQQDQVLHQEGKHCQGRTPRHQARASLATPRGVRGADSGAEQHRPWPALPPAQLRAETPSEEPAEGLLPKKVLHLEPGETPEDAL